MSEKLYNRDNIDKAVAMFEERELDSAEALLASARLFTQALDRFKKEAPAFRARVGEERIRDFAMEEFNDLVYEIQDAVPVAVRIFNSLMRSPEDPKGTPGG